MCVPSLVPRPHLVSLHVLLKAIRTGIGFGSGTETSVYHTEGNVVSNGSFSKIFGPGIRLGWMEVPLRVKDAITNRFSVTFELWSLHHVTLVHFPLVVAMH